MNLIEFPNLGNLKIPVDPVAFTVFGIPIYWYGIIIAAGFMLAVLLAMRDSKKYEIDPENVIDLVLFATPVAIVFARLYYVIFKWEDYRNNLLEIINTRKGGLAIYGGIIGALLVAYIFARVKKLNPLKLLDFGIPYVALAQSIGRWGNFVNQEAFGTNTMLPWGMTSERIRNELTIMQMEGKLVNPALPVHPTFLYESLLDLIVFFVLIWFRKKKKLEGEVLFLYLILYGFGRFLVEGLRTDSLMLGNLRVSQALSFVLVVAFGIAFVYRRIKLKNAVPEEVFIGTSEYGNVLKRLMAEENISAGASEAAEAESAAEESAKNPAGAEGSTETAEMNDTVEENAAETNEEKVEQPAEGTEGNEEKKSE